MSDPSRSARPTLTTAQTNTSVATERPLGADHRVSTPWGGWLVGGGFLLVGLALWAAIAIFGTGKVEIVFAQQHWSLPLWSLPLSGLLIAAGLWVLMAAIYHRILQSGPRLVRVTQQLGVSPPWIAAGILLEAVLCARQLAGFYDDGRAAFILIFGSATVLFAGGAAAAIRADGGLWLESHWGGLGGGLGGWRMSQTLGLILMTLVAGTLTVAAATAIFEAPSKASADSAKPPPPPKPTIGSGK